MIKHRSLMQTENRNPRVQLIILEIRFKCQKLGKPCFQYYLFTVGLGFLCLPQRSMIDFISQDLIAEYHIYLVIRWSILFPKCPQICKSVV